MSNRIEPEVLWREGMFLCPQHLQSFARQVAARIDAAESLGRVGNWGVVEADIDQDALERDVLRLESATVRFRDGTLANFPRNARVEQREFATLFQGPELDVHLGIPASREGVAELGGADDDRARFHAEVVDVHDENLKDEARDLEVRILHGRLFFGDEERSGFECVPLARLVRKGKPVAVSALSSEFIPPAVTIGGAPVLARRLRDLADAVRSQARDLAARIPNTTGLSSVERGADVAGFVKLQAVNQCVAALDQVAQQPGLHPFWAYGAVVQAVANLAIFGTDRVVPQLPSYRHEDATECFRQVIELAQSLIPAEVSVPYDTAPFAEDPMRQGCFTCALPAEWLQGRSLMFLGVELAKPAEEVVPLVKTGIKLLAEENLDRVLQGVVPGIGLEHVRTPPLAFPKRPDLHYFSVQTDGPSASAWQGIEKARGAILLTALGAIGASFHFYVELQDQ